MSPKILELNFPLG
jgi:hypothetical protein